MSGLRWIDAGGHGAPGACARSSSADAGVGPTRTQAAPPTVTETAAPEDTAMRPTAPAIEGTTLDGEQASLAALRGKQVFVNVWSSW